MTDEPVLGQVGFVTKRVAVKIEIVGEMKPKEWNEFVECLRECAKRFRGKIRIIDKRYQLPKKAVRKRR
jgi:hypothetical protein